MGDGTTNRAGFFRGLLSAVIVVVFSQVWVWYDKNEKSEQAAFDLQTELIQNRAFIEMVREELSPNRAITQVAWLRSRRVAEQTSRSAFERSRLYLTYDRDSFAQAIAEYYTELLKFHSLVDSNLLALNDDREQAEEKQRLIETSTQQIMTLAFNKDKVSDQKLLRNLANNIAVQIGLLAKIKELIEKDYQESSKFGGKQIGLEIQMLLSHDKSASAVLDALRAACRAQRIYLRCLVVALLLTLVALTAPLSLTFQRSRTE